MPYQPMSLNMGSVRSAGGFTLCRRSALMNGSISRFLNALVSQCETEEPPWNGFGVNRNTRPSLSAPASCDGSTLRRATTLELRPDGESLSEALILLPVA